MPQTLYQKIQQLSCIVLFTPLLGHANTKLEEVVVTAQKREQRLLDTPLSISVINNRRMAAHGIDTLGNIAATVPNFQVALPNGDVLPIFSIRGISMADYSVNQSSPIGVYLDEMYLSANYTHGLPIFDLERIEVLRGPQGTLYGKNTTGGAINLISRTPDFKADGAIKLTTGNYRHQTIEAAYETPLIDQQLSARLAIKAEQADGYAKNHAAAGKDLSATDRHSTRLVINYQPSDTFSALLRLNSGRSTPEAPAIIPQATMDGLDLLSTILQGAGEPFYVRPAHYDGHDADANKVDATKIKTDGGALTLHWENADWILTSITGLYKGDYDHRADSDGTPQQLLEVNYLTNMDQWSQDFRISNQQSGPLAYTVGLYFAEENIDTDVTFNFFHSLREIAPTFNPLAGGFTQKQQYEQKRESHAIYGQFSYNLATNTTLTAGLRYTEDKNSQFNVHTYIADYDGIPQAGLIPFNASYDPNAIYPKQSFTDHQWSGTLKLDHNINENILVYGSYSRGYRSGAFNGAAVNDASELKSVEPETVNAYELGIKGQHLNGRLQYSSALFYYDYRNQQFINVVGTRQLLDSAKRARIQGVELELHALATEELTLHFGLGILESEYKEGPILDAGGESWDLSGNQLIAAPDLNANIALDYRFNLNGNNLAAHVDLNYIDDQWFTAFNDTANYGNISQSAYTLLNSRLEFQPANSNITLALWGKNLEDKEYKVYAINLSDSFGYHYTIVGAPRTYGAEITLSF